MKINSSFPYSDNLILRKSNLDSLIGVVMKKGKDEDKIMATPKFGLYIYELKEKAFSICFRLIYLTKMGKI